MQKDTAKKIEKKLSLFFFWFGDVLIKKFEDFEDFEALKDVNLSEDIKRIKSVKNFFKKELARFEVACFAFNVFINKIKPREFGLICDQERECFDLMSDDVLIKKEMFYKDFMSIFRQEADRLNFKEILCNLRSHFGIFFNAQRARLSLLFEVFDAYLEERDVRLTEGLISGTSKPQSDISLGEDGSEGEQGDEVYGEGVCL
ncbi:MAG: hypothetical protein ABH827_06105 [bacterium]